MTFRKMNFEDIEFVNEVRNECREFLKDDRTFSMRETYEWFINTKPDWWMIEIDGHKAGYFRLSDRSIANGNLLIGADLHKDWRGKGLAYQAYVRFMNWLFEYYEYLHKISLEVLATNTRAINLYKKLGFVLEGTKREEVRRGSTYIDYHFMSILRSEWNKKEIN